MVSKPQAFDLDGLIKMFPPGERVYRMRCVEAWSMVIPWDGFQLSKLLDAVEPLGGAKYVAFDTVVRPSEMPGRTRRLDRFRGPTSKGFGSTRRVVP